MLQGIRGALWGEVCWQLWAQAGLSQLLSWTLHLNSPGTAGITGQSLPTAQPECCFQGLLGGKCTFILSIKVQSIKTEGDNLPWIHPKCYMKF